MAKQEIQGRSFTKCDAFWEANEKETLTGVLIDVNERFPNKIKGPNEVKPLYMLKSLGVKGEKASLMKDEQPVKNAKGIIVGVFDCSDLNDKIYKHYATLVGKEVTITFTAKESFTKDGVTRSIKKFTVLAEDTVNPEFGGDVVTRQVTGTAASAPEAGDVGPYAT